MILIVGYNSYVTVEEAKELLDGNAFYEKFNALSESKQQKLLCDSAMRIDSLPFEGRKKDIAQYMEFPRGQQEEVPFQVKQAQVLEAVCVLDDEAESRRKIQEQGVTSVTLGKVSESYGGVTATSGGLRSPDAFLLLRKYISGSVAIV